MRWLAALLVVPLLAGCLGGLGGGDGDDPRPVLPADVGRDPASVRVTGTERVAFSVLSFDGTNLSAIAYVPQGSLPDVDGKPNPDAPLWPVVLFVHGWGGSKESYEGSLRGSELPDGAEPELPEQAGERVEPNHLLEFAQAGFIAVAYDARGFGESGGDTAVAGPNEMKDLEAVRAYVEDGFPDNGLFGVTGQSYGGGHSFLAWADNPRITTAVPQYGWIDLYDALLPGNVPKMQWAQFLYAYGMPGAGGDYNPMVTEWYQRAYTRTDLEEVEAQMDARSVRDRLASTDKPLFLCQGMQESLFPQADEAWEGAAGFTRAYIFTGGHGLDDPECWSLTLDWFRFFLAGYDTHVDDWPALRTQDARDGLEVSFEEFPETSPRHYYLRAPDLAEGTPSSATFEVTQSLAANPFMEPGAIWDQAGLPYQSVPEQLREDPSAVLFETAPLDGSAVLLGAPTLRLALAEDAPRFQVTAALFVESEGQSQVLSRGAVALGPLEAGETVPIRLHWVKADLGDGDRLVLKVAPNDPSWFMPLAADYTVTFDGSSALDLPFYGS